MIPQILLQLDKQATTCVKRLCHKNKLLLTVDVNVKGLV